MAIASATADGVGLVLLVAASVLAAIGRWRLVRQDWQEERAAPRRQARTDPLNFRNPRDLAIVVTAVLLGLVSFVVLLAGALHS